MVPIHYGAAWTSLSLGIGNKIQWCTQGLQFAKAKNSSLCTSEKSLIIPNKKELRACHPNSFCYMNVGTTIFTRLITTSTEQITPLVHMVHTHLSQLLKHGQVIACNYFHTLKHRERGWAKIGSLKINTLMTYKHTDRERLGKAMALQGREFPSSSSHWEFRTTG